MAEVCFKFCPGCPAANGVEEVVSDKLQAVYPAIVVQYVDVAGNGSEYMQVETDGFTPDTRGVAAQVVKTRTEVCNNSGSANDEEYKMGRIKRFVHWVGRKSVSRRVYCGAFPGQNPKKLIVKTPKYIPVAD